MSAFETGNKLREGPNGEPLTKTCLTTHSLKVLDLAAPVPEAICLEDIAHGLSQHVRWAGQGGWMSVAQHSVLVVRAIESYGRKYGWDGSDRLLRTALMHDAHEAYIGDLSGGLKFLLRESALKDLIFGLDMAIEYAIGYDATPLGQDQDCLKWAEEWLVPIEYNVLFRPDKATTLQKQTIEGPLCQKLSEGLFLGEAERLGLGSVDAADGS